MNTLHTYITQLLWPTEYPDGKLLRAAMWVARYLYVLIRDLINGEITMRATSMVYTTLMALVPMMAVSFSLLKAMGVHTKQLEPLMLQFLAPMGEQGQQITTQIIGFIDGVNINVLGAAGICFLLYSSLSLIYKIEGTFNAVWQVTTKRQIGRRITDYFAAMLLGPSMMFFAIAFTASALSNASSSVGDYAIIEHGISLVSQLMPYAIIIATFTFFYTFIPNTKVSIKAALVAGIVSGICWQSVGWMFGTFVVAAKTSATYAIYSGFAILILFMLWLYIGWVILLLGSSLAFYLQHPEQVRLKHNSKNLTPMQVKHVGLQFLFLVTEQFYSSQNGSQHSDATSTSVATQQVTPEHIARKEKLLLEQVQPVCCLLEQAGYVARVEGSHTYVLASDAQSIPIAQVLQTLEYQGEQVADDMQDWIMQKLNTNTSSEFGSMTIYQAWQQSLQG